jgi:hypothetical protein
VSAPIAFGVIGAIHHPTSQGLRAVQVPEEHHFDPLPYSEHSLMRWVLASQLVLRLTQVTVVALDRELAHAQR